MICGLLFDIALIFFLLAIKLYSADTEKELLTIEPSGPVAVFDVMCYTIVH